MLARFVARLTLREDDRQSVTSSMRPWYVLSTSAFPSPRPSPQGRGRIVVSQSANRALWGTPQDEHSYSMPMNRTFNASTPRLVPRLFPSLHPSPLGRGSHVSRSSTDASAADRPIARPRFSLSPGERAGVRGNRINDRVWRQSIPRTGELYESPGGVGGFAKQK